MRRADLAKLDEEDLPQKKPKKKPRKKVDLSKFSWIWSPLSIGIVGAFIGAIMTYMISSSSTEANLGLESRLHRENLQFQNTLSALRGIYDVGGSVGRDLQAAERDPTNYQFHSVSLRGVTNKRDLRRAIAYASMLPGLRRLDLEDTACDDSVLEDIEANFVTLDYLNLAKTKITVLNSIDTLKLAELNINQTPLIYEQFAVLARMENLQKLTLGPPTLQADGETIYRAPIEDILAHLRAAEELYEVKMDSTNDKFFKLDDQTIQLLSNRKPDGA